MLQLVVDPVNPMRTATGLPLHHRPMHKHTPAISRVTTKSYVPSLHHDSLCVSSLPLLTNIMQNIVTGTTCASSPCDGFSRGTANHGWAGSKMFVVNFDMPTDSTGSLPAIWILNSQVTNSAQYGCNCRGVGGNGGCGELDVLETLSANVNQGITEIYSFKGATGSGSTNYFPRPTSGAVTYAVILDIQTNSIMIEKLGSWDFGQTSVSRSTIDGFLNTPATVVSF